MSSPRVIVVGAGFGGLIAAIELRRSGIEDVTILERGPGLGGTWRDNTYPGAACDVPSHLYSLSYAQRRDWSRLCSPQDEILRYLHAVAREHGVDRLVVPDTEVTACRWDDARATWTVETARGATYEAGALVMATGQLHRPAYPRIAAGPFAGHTFHSARWDHDYDLRDKRVAVVGTGASAVQFVPEIAKQASRLVVFQRTGNWFMPRRNRPYPAWWKALIRAVPGLQRWRRRFVFDYGESLTAMIRHPRTVGRVGAARSATFMRWQLRGHPELRRAVWPDYTFGCKRVLFSSHFLPALARPNVDLVTDAVTGTTPTGIRTADGRVHEVDCIIYATGFKTNDFMFPMEIAGAGGASLREAWRDGASAHLGMTVPGFPNMFILYGPNTNTSGGSILVYLEAQAAYVRQALQHAGARGAAAVDVRPEAAAAQDRAVQGAFAGTAWTACDSWYRDEGGRIVANWPGYMREYVARTATFDPADHRLVEPVPAAAPGDDDELPQRRETFTV
jgi:cation diffusion facilitator CzcD-associated flavoprotein CzcO